LVPYEGKRNLLHGLFAAMHQLPTLLARADEVIE
jgi:hypothetical protein